MGSKMVSVGAPGGLDIRTWQGADFDLTIKVGTADRTAQDIRFTAVYSHDGSVLYDIDQTGAPAVDGAVTGLADGRSRLVVPRVVTANWSPGVFDYMWEAEGEPLVSGLLIVKPSAVTWADQSGPGPLGAAAAWAELAGATMSQGQ